eukprot:scaffold61988_cov20-Tisochrysis_lutea.AAC.3
MAAVKPLLVKSWKAYRHKEKGVWVWVWGEGVGMLRAMMCSIVCVHEQRRACVHSGSSQGSSFHAADDALHSRIPPNACPPPLPTNSTPCALHHYNAPKCLI